MQRESRNEILRLKNAFQRLGCSASECSKIADTLQGSIWRSLHLQSKRKVVIKVTNRELHAKSMIIVQGQEIFVTENIMREKAILRSLSRDINCPKSIIKYIAFFKRYRITTYIYIYIYNLYEFVCVIRNI